MCMRKKQAVLTKDEDFSVDLTLHDFPVSLLGEFAENMVGPYYEGNVNAALQDLIHKVLADQKFVDSHIVMVRNSIPRSKPRRTTSQEGCGSYAERTLGKSGAQQGADGNAS